jgi:hypothetical protein
VKYRLAAQSAEEVEANPSLNWQPVAPGTLTTLGVPLLVGRDFRATDVEDAPRVVIVGETFAKRAWPGADPIGQRLFTAGGLHDPKTKAPVFQTVVGVVADGRYRHIEASALDVFVPVRQSNGAFAGTLVVRSLGRPEDVAPRVRRAVAAVDPELPVDEVLSLDHAIASASAPWRFNAAMLAVLAGLGCLLCATGLWGMLAYAVGRRMKEIAIRQAVGATPSQVVRLIAGEGLRAVIVGTALGLVGSAGLAPFLRRLLYGVDPASPWILLTVGGSLVALGAAVSALASRSAARVDIVRGLGTL